MPLRPQREHHRASELTSTLSENAERLAGPPRWERPALLAAIAAGVLAYLPSLFGGFTVDDHPAIEHHPGVTGSILDVVRFDWFGRPFASTIGSYRPVVTASFWLDYHLGGGSPAVFHVVNLLLYGAVLVAFHATLKRLADGVLSSAGRVLATAVVATLAIHVDVVPSASGRSELLGALFTLVSLYAATDPEERHTSALVYAAALTAAMFSKETTIAITLLAPLVAARRATPKRVRVLGAISLVAFVGFVWFRLSSHLTPTMSEWEDHNLLLGRPWLERWLGGAEVVTYYLQHTLVPIDLLYAYGYSAIVPGHGLTLRAAIGVAVIAAYIAALVIALRRRHPSSSTLLALGASYVAVSQLLTPATELLADRWFFLPTLWLVASLAFPIDAWLRARGARARVPVAAVLAFALAQGAIAAAASLVWHDDATLARYSIAAQANAIGPRLLSANVAAKEGRVDDAAWSLLAAYSIQASFPAPVAVDAVPAEWEALSPEDRVAALRARIGEPLFQRVRAVATRHAYQAHYDDVADLLATMR